MGRGSSKPKVRRPAEAKHIPGILPIGDLASVTNDIENLVFASGGALVFSYVGAVRVLEKLGVLKGIKRFAGVGVGAIIAALLAMDFNSSEIQDVLDQSIDDLIADDRTGLENLSENISEDYGWNAGTKFQDSFGNLLASKSNETNLTFLQLYEKTGKELCIIAANVDKLTIEYFHPKTTPDLPITRALFMSLSIPGIFAPMKYGRGIEKYYLVNGSLLCSYPIYCFDGWMLSMDAEDSILNQLEDPDHYQFPQKVFNLRNQRTLGFYPIEKYREHNYKELSDRLTNATAGIRIPDTTLGEKYKTALQQQRCSSEKFASLREACSTLTLMAESAEDEDQNISEDLLAENIFASDPLSKEDRTLFLPELRRDAEECANFLKTLACKGSKLTRTVFTKFVERKILAALNEYSGYYKADINNVHAYFGTVFEAKRQSSFDLSKVDFDRTVGIFCGYVGSRNINIENDDQTFLYLQGWNATVAFFQQMNRRNISDANDEPVNQSA